MTTSIPGQRTFLSEIELQVATNPNKVYASIPLSPTLTTGYKDVTVVDFNKAVNRLCAFLEPLIGNKGQDAAPTSTVAYYGLMDVRYQLIIPALVKLGHIALFSAPRNSPAMHMHLLNETKCKIVLHAKHVVVSALLGGEKATEGLQVIAIPDVADLLFPSGETEEPKAYPYTRTWEQARMDPFLVLHTSGSTGMPKPIYQRHEWLAAGDRQMYMDKVNGVETLFSLLAKPARGYKGFPPWHTGGSSICGILVTIFGSNAFVWGPPERLPSLEDFKNIVELGKCSHAVGTPILFEDLARNDKYLEVLKPVEYFWLGGGPISETAGSIISKHTKILNFWGTTEACSPSIALVSQGGWKYFHISPSSSCLEFRELYDGTYEGVLKRTGTDDDKLFAIWATFPELKEWSSKDLFRKHPTVPNHWTYCGRVDDLIVFRNAAKHNPLAFEAQVRTNPVVKDALVIGTGKMQCALLVELAEPIKEGGDEAKAQRIEQLWPTVSKANEAAPKHAIVQKNHILFAKADKPFLRAAKGTVQRNPTLEAYSEEIDGFYAKVGNESMNGYLPDITDRPASVQPNGSYTNGSAH